tara:strand:+ start:316 stop:540 length:225 start_codon:yes stop_codon:yes gene_type:complete
MDSKKLILYTNDKTGRNIWMTEKYTYESDGDYDRESMMATTHFVIREGDEEVNENLFHGLRLFLGTHGELLGTS